MDYTNLPDGSQVTRILYSSFVIQHSSFAIRHLAQRATEPKAAAYCGASTASFIIRHSMSLT
jgi:hypothetical protein